MVPFSWAVCGNDAAVSGINGAMIGGFIGMNRLFKDDDER